MSRESIQSRLASRKPLLFDGAIGTELLNRTHSIHSAERPTDILTLTHPEIVSQLHREYLQAGADIISTNSFNANGISLGKAYSGADILHLNKTAAEIARAACDIFNTDVKPRYLAGIIGPSFFTSTDPIIPETIKQAYEPQITGLLEGGVDCLLIETAYDLKVTEHILKLIRVLDPKIPLWVSFAPTGTGFTLSTGETITQAFECIAPFNPVCIGVNCIEPSDAIISMEKVELPGSVYRSIHPNAGNPGPDGKYPINGEEFAKILQKPYRSGQFSIIGGCCGSTPSYISRLGSLCQL